MGQDQVSGGVIVLCWLAAPVANVLWEPIYYNFHNSNKLLWLIHLIEHSDETFLMSRIFSQGTSVIACTL